ncbi:unnamed protein product [Prorocentrum cordatum]|uniref:Uncharacterized protein n=1 Tax=Prorocentrum cordatum TaxID=2364126 RepID=A0ABN9TQ03_9DINO|nr:unnamed protein product [Polarella glacialis]
MGGAPTDVSVGSGKNAKILAREFGCKKIMRELYTMYGENRSFVDKEKAVVSSSWKDLVCFAAAPLGIKPTAHFCRASVRAQVMDAWGVRNRCLELFADVQNAEWCL